MSPTAPEPPPTLRSAVITVGDELLLGRTVDTNAAWLSERLAELGAPVVRRYTVGDEDSAIRQVLETALQEAEVVLTSGGLGPTSDDRTRDAVAGALGRGLHVDAAILEALTERFRTRGYATLPPDNRRQAEIPEGATPLQNPVGTAPGLVLEHEGALVALLPGVPRELRAIYPALEGQLRRLQGRRLRPVKLRTLHTSGIPESVLAPRVEQAMGDLEGVEVAFLPDLKGVDVRLTVKGADGDGARAALDEAEARLGPVVARHRIPGSGEVAREVVSLLADQGRTLAVGESCTGGLAARRVTDVPGASSVFLGGMVAYANEAKVKHLGIDREVLAAHGAVSRPVALAMAQGAAAVFGADCGIGITGVAGPGGGTPEKPVGTVHIAATVGEESAAEEWHFPEDREAVRIRSAQAALVLLYRLADRVS